MRDKRLKLLGFISPGERPAHIAGGVTHIGTNAASSPLFFIGQGLDDEWHNCKQTKGLKLCQISFCGSYAFKKTMNKTAVFKTFLEALYKT